CIREEPVLIGTRRWRRASSPRDTSLLMDMCAGTARSSPRAMPASLRTENHYPLDTVLGSMVGSSQGRYILRRTSTTPASSELPCAASPCSRSPPCSRPPRPGFTLLHTLEPPFAARRTTAASLCQKAFA